MSAVTDFWDSTERNEQMTEGFIKLAKSKGENVLFAYEMKQKVSHHTFNCIPELFSMCFVLLLLANGVLCFSFTITEMSLIKTDTVFMEDIFYKLKQLGQPFR